MTSVLEGANGVTEVARILFCNQLPDADKKVGGRVSKVQTICRRPSSMATCHNQGG